MTNNNINTKKADFHNFLIHMSTSKRATIVQCPVTTNNGLQ